MLRKLSMLALAGAMLFSMTAAQAEDRRVRVINETRFTITHLYGSNVGTQSWEEDILGDKVLGPGQSVVVNFDDGSGYCKFDFMAKFEDGDTAIKQGVDVCTISSFRFTE
jgi:hypothetical protein